MCSSDLTAPIAYDPTAYNAATTADGRTTALAALSANLKAALQALELEDGSPLKAEVTSTTLGTFKVTLSIGDPIVFVKTATPAAGTAIGAFTNKSAAVVSATALAANGSVVARVVAGTPDNPGNVIAGTTVTATAAMTAADVANALASIARLPSSITATASSADLILVNAGDSDFYISAPNGPAIGSADAISPYSTGTSQYWQVNLYDSDSKVLASASSA